MKYNIDRFESDIAILEDESGKRREIKKILLPQEAKEGDVVIDIDGKYEIDEETTKKRRAETLALLRKLGL